MEDYGEKIITDHRPAEIWLKKLDFALRAGTMDEILIKFNTNVRKRTPRVNAKHLMRYMKARREYRKHHLSVGATLRNWTGIGTPLEEGSLNSEILTLLAQLGLEAQVFSYLSRFDGSYPAEIASACEFLEVIPFDHSLVSMLGKSSGLRQGHILNYFRSAQRIRDEHGITPHQQSDSNGFLTFGDIVQFERKIAENDPVDFMIQCIKLRLVDERHLQAMFKSISTHSQLVTFYDGVIRNGEDAVKKEAASYFVLAFRTLKNSTPTWPELKKYLEEINYVDLENGVFFQANILIGEADDALKCVLKHLARIFSAFPANSLSGQLRRVFEELFEEDLLPDLMTLLDWGAEFNHVGADGKYTVETLIELANIVNTLPLLVFSLYLCCPLGYRGTRVGFDVYQPAPLACLAARRVPRSGNASARPGGMDEWVKIHQTLQSLFDKIGNQLPGSEGTP